MAAFELSELLYVLPWDLPAFAIDLLHLLGIPNSRILRHDHDNEQLQFDEIVLPTVLRNANRLHSCFAAATEFWTSMLAFGKALPSTQSRLFVSRAGATSNRTLLNRSALEGIAVSQGFNLVYPEKLSIPEQIQLFRGAVQIVGEYGSALHNTMFSQSAAICVALRGTSHAPGFIQSSLARAFDQGIGYVFAPTPEHADEANFEIEEIDFRLALDCLKLWPVDPDS
jgi:capsular polysaccharide biosynthesis protein